MILPGAKLRKDRSIVTKIKNDLYNAFGYNDFFMQRRAPLHLPDSLDGIAETRCLWYVKVVVQECRKLILGQGDRQKRCIAIPKVYQDTFSLIF